MKDYRLSEIVAHCIERQTLCDGTVYYDCANCEHNEICHTTKWGSVIGNDIEPRDMIELPYKQFHELYAGFGLWFIFYRNKEGLMDSRYFEKEQSADAFMAELKGDGK